MRMVPLLALLAPFASGCALFPDLSIYGECTEGAACGGAGPSSSSGMSTVTSASTGTSTTTTGTTTTSSSSSSGSGSGTSSSTGSGMTAPCDLTAAMHGSEGIHIVSPFPAFCVDRTEVSVGQYRDFLENHVGNDLMSADFPTECSWKTSTFGAFEPKGAGGSDPYMWTHYDPKQKEDKPVQGVDWCDAKIYCQWAGKDLCGSNTGTPIDSTGGPATAWLKSGQWYRACSGMTQTNYAYGNTYDQDACNTHSAYEMSENSPFKTTNVTEPSTCVATWDDGVVFNMNGNVMEWEDNCEATGTATPQDDTCYPRGGSYNLTQYTACDYVDNNAPHRRDRKGEYLGFRCCW